MSNPEHLAKLKGGVEAWNAWPAAIKRERHIGDFTQWKDHDSCTKAFERLLEDLMSGGRTSTSSV